MPRANNNAPFYNLSDAQTPPNFIDVVQVESVAADGQGGSVVTMASGATHAVAVDPVLLVGQFVAIWPA